jgi:hypothetical protein
MNIPSRSAFIAAAILLIAPAIGPQIAWAQTPAQMEYERQQREYWRQQEQQRQEQQRQQQIMNENARRQQEESRRLNAPMPQSQSPAPSYQGSQGYQGGTRQTAPQQQALRSNATAATAAAKWAVVARSPDRGGAVAYADPVTLRRSGNLARLWELWDFKTTQVVEGKRLLSTRWQNEYDCKAARMRNLSITGFSGHMGNGTVVGYGNALTPWEPVAAGTIKADLRNFACGKK